MKKMIPVYILLLAILGVFIFELRELKAMRVELVGIRREQVKRYSGGPIGMGGGQPVFVTNEPLEVKTAR